MKQSIWKRLNFSLLYPLLSVVAFIGVNGYRYGISNHSYQIPFVKKLLDGGLFVNDYIFDFEYKNTFYYLIIAKLLKLSGLRIEVLFFILFLLFAYLYFYVLQKIGLILSGDRFTSYLIPLFFVSSKPLLSAEQSYYQIFYYNNISIVLCLLSFYFFLRNKYVLTFFILGMMFNLHLLYSVYLFVPSFLYIVYLFVKKRISKRYLYILFSVFILSSLPVLIWKFIFSDRVFCNFDYTKWIELMKVRNSHHVFPSMWPINQFNYLGYLLFFSVFFLILLLIKKRNAFREPVFIVLFFLLVWLIGFVVYTLLVELFFLKPVILIQWGRSSVFLYHFCIISIVYVLCAICNRSSYFLLFLFCLYHFGISLNILNLAIGIVMLFFLFKLHSFVIVSVLLFSIISFFRFENIRLALIDYGIRYDKWTHIQLWVKENTDKNSIFIVPPNIDNFRVFSDRSIFTSYKDGTMVFFSKCFSKKWFERMSVFGTLHVGTNVDKFKYDVNSENNFITTIDCNECPIYVVSSDLLYTDPVFSMDGLFVFKLK